MLEKYVSKKTLRTLPLAIACVLCTGYVTKSRSSIELPGKGYVSLSDKVIPQGHFSWAEVTKNGERIPKNPKIVENIVRTAYELEEVRSHFGNKPIKVNSWYRDDNANKEAGGEKNSRHLYGDAVDIVISGINPKIVYAQLDKNHYGGLGEYKSFDHIDWRGYKARWKGK
jgi:hypothetical protein